MMRSVFVALIFFFGPVILMFMVRRLLILLRIWLLMRRTRHEDDVIDVTPHHEPVPPSVWFVAAAILMGLTFAVLAWRNIQYIPEAEGVYTPAYMDEQGRIIEGEIKPVPPKPASSSPKPGSSK